jgi:hypothetical protein
MMKLVKRAIFVLVLLFGSVALSAQVHGPAPSVNSFTGRSMSVGPAPSVLSVGPRGFQGGSVQFGQRFNGHVGHGGEHHRHGNIGGGYVYSYAYPYPVYAYPDQVDGQDQVQAQDQSMDPPAPTVYERRPEVRLAPNPTPTEASDDPRYGQHYLDQREQGQNTAPLTPGNHNMSPVTDEQIPILIVYKDGHQQQIQNYAIVGDTLYDLGNVVAHKIKLADLDLQQTIQKNEQRGVDFSVPTSYKPAA